MLEAMWNQRKNFARFFFLALFSDTSYRIEPLGNFFMLFCFFHMVVINNQTISLNSAKEIR